MTNRALIPDSAWHRFRQTLAGIDTTLFLIGRDLDGWLKSLWKQALINPVPRGKRLMIPEFAAFSRLPAIRAMMDLGPISTLIAEKSGASSSVICRMEGDFIGAFAALLGLPPDARMQDAPRINESLPDDFIAVYVRLARHVDHVWHLRLAVFAAFHALQPTGNLTIANVARHFRRASTQDRRLAVDIVKGAVDAVTFDDPRHRDLAARIVSRAAALVEGD